MSADRKNKPIKNPLRHRYLRELKGDFGKYLVIFLLMAMSVAEVSGFLVADESMIRAYNESFEKYRIEDGHFETESALTPNQKKRIEENGITLYENDFVNVRVNPGTQQGKKQESAADTQESSTETLRIYKMRTEVDLADLMEGAFPEKQGEIAVDRMYADNNNLKVGDVIARAGSGSDQNADKGTGRRGSWTITGLVALSDYSALFEDNNDSMFDAVTFGVAVVSEEEFDSFSGKTIHHNYAWMYNEKPADTTEEKDRADDLMKKINEIVPLETFIPRYDNQAIQFTGEDMGGDRAMMMVLLYMIIAILGFVFAVTIGNTIRKEANVIGTLRASGYTRGELVRHYMVMPIVVTLVSAAVGNILGYTVMKDANAGLYYGSYSLPTYRTIWSTDAFFETTLVPVVLMVIITYLMLSRALKVPPLQFLRGEVSRKGRSRAVRLNHNLPIFGRFRLRVFFQNLPNYAILFLGILFADVLLMFGLALPLTLTHYQESVGDNLLSNYQYILSVPASMERDEENSIDLLGSLVDSLTFQYGVRTDNKDAEEFSVGTLKTTGDEGRIVEDVTLYGVKNHSKYIHADLKKGEILASSAYAEKYGLGDGSLVTLKEEYGEKTYEFTISGIYNYEGALCLIMPIDDLNETLGYDDGFFAGYFSDTEITDLDPAYVGTVIDLESLTKISRQLDVSMGGIMSMIDGFAVIMFMILVYLLTKTIIEKNAQSISMSKILGYSSREIGKIYLRPTTWAAVVLLAVSIPVVRLLLIGIYNYYLLTQMAGYMPVYLDTELYLKMFFMGLAVYLVVMIFEMRKIRRIPMTMALKNAE